MRRFSHALGALTALSFVIASTPHARASDAPSGGGGATKDKAARAGGTTTRDDGGPWAEAQEDDKDFGDDGFNDKGFGDRAGSGGGLLFKVTAGDAHRRWTLLLRNVSASPIIVDTDPRLLWFDVSVPGKENPVTCRLPGKMFPKRVDRDFVFKMKPGERVRRRFDPRLYCFSTKGQTTLVAGAIVEPHFGWAKKPPSAERFVVKPAKKSDEIAPFSKVAGQGFALDSSYAGWSASRLPDHRKEHCSPAEPTLAITRGSDVSYARNALVTLKVKNPCDNSLRVFFRRDLVSFTVKGPEGRVHCNSDPDERTPLAGHYARLRPGRSATYPTRIIEMCPPGTFARPGVYRINATFHALSSGEEHGYDAFVGDARTHETSLLRVRVGDGHLFTPKAPKKPRKRKHKKRHRESPESESESEAKKDFPEVAPI